ncbi:BirA family biotin operon repressor/biotin-[acetyl-CoA-carboxylase] ligase [Labedella gwakjiensis]|uniref:biotin--[biotin carboxyl-carrier protein] ligase n=1 Tax=Labedella gwakjiensis TaxID=390269 RepID=A0A2P8GXR8_9MICO|nr:biotin--[acetyl-CoA-carboxylase] ligase [Labedella gwakjiensis]PSL38766.1 BirA family biotin operon repressor/biotin-[acetyl-CoA-carboxylase] ligase [Labedella gwakjiensis]RUQ86753.1 biotin--[acetyl-CoA-carboxylase] ligase [Labedella gwakjiensis]
MIDDAPLLDRSSRLAARLEWRAQSASTNADLVAAAADPGWPDLSVIATDTQTAGRGRLDRTWVTPPGSALAVSVLLRPAVPIERLGWIPLIAGLAVARTADSLLDGVEDVGVAVKWPNDVLIGGRKLCGILAELTADGSVVVGAGINTAATADELPVDTATSLAVEGASTTAVDDVLSTYLTELSSLYRSFVDAGGDATAAGIRAAVTERCATVGSRIRLDMPGGGVVHGTARGIDADGRLVVQPHDGSGLLPVSAGDVTHVRPDA